MSSFKFGAALFCLTERVIDVVCAKLKRLSISTSFITQLPTETPPCHIGGRI